MRAILFDFNGILVNDEPVHQELMQKVLAEEGIELSDARFEEVCLGRADRAAFQDVLRQERGETDLALVARLVARKTAYYHVRMRTDGFPFFPGARELVAATADAGLGLGVVSGALRAEVDAALDQTDLRSRFKTITTAEDVDHSKPDPEGFLRGLRHLNTLPPLPTRLLHPHEVLAIEDSPAGLAAARAAGLATLGVAHTFPAERLEADRVVESLAAISLQQLQGWF
ncbi:MAG: HAD family phosphatase [Thermoanaerobaculia bacterium]|nr:HAD family phosphatase [Thermoanaerobaculia bacterium]